jgi:electron transfer flavoprotein-quinone oxidoreductase
MERSDFSKQSLGVYVDKLRQSFVLRELEFYRRAPAFMDSTPRVFGVYPEVAAAMMKRMFTVDGVTPPTHAGPLAREALQGKASLWQVGVDAWKGANAL